MKKSLASFFLLLFGLASGVAQNPITLKGKVTGGEENYLLIGAKVFFSDTYQGTHADIDGLFELRSEQPLPWNLKVEYIGYIEQEFTVMHPDTFQLIKMIEDPKSLDKVIILPIEKPKKTSLITIPVNTDEELSETKELCIIKPSSIL